MMTRKVSLFILLTLLSFGMVNHAEAQFWKKMFHKDHPKKTSPKSSKTVKTTTPKKKKDIEYAPTHMRSRYRVDILVPLYLDELVVNNKPTFKDKIPEKASSGIDFYEGVKIAGDTLQKLNYDLDIFVHDITTEKGNPEYLISTNRLDSSDLVIGAVQTKDIPAIAHFAASHHINFISALSPADGGVRDDLYFTLLQPSLQTHCEYIKSTLTSAYPKKKVVLFYRTGVTSDENAFGYLVKSDTEKVFKKVLCNTAPTKEYLSTIFDSTVTNVIVMTILDNTYAATLLKQLVIQFPGYKFDVFGMPSWRSMEVLRKNELGPDIRVNIPAPFNFDMTASVAKYIDHSYKKDVGGKPGELVFRGYETLFWYADLLKKYGTVFNTKMTDTEHATLTKFDIKLKRDKEQGIYYSENQHVYLYKYQNGSYKVE